MWILYYLNEKRVTDISYQLTPSLLKEQKILKKKNVGINGKSAFSLNNVFSKLFKFDNEINAKADINSDSLTTFEYPEIDQKTKNALDFFAKQKNYISLDENTDDQTIKPTKLIRFSGMFHPNIGGETYSERLSKYESSKNICWLGKCGYFQLSFFTSKLSLISNTPIHPALEAKNGKIFFEGFGVFSKRNGNKLTITPIIIGTQLDK